MSTPKRAVPTDLRVSDVVSPDGETLVVFSWPLALDERTSAPTLPAEAAAKLAELTPAERAVHALLLAGMPDETIASLRGTTRSTVTKQVDAVFRKLGVRSRRELVARSV